MNNNLFAPSELVLINAQKFIKNLELDADTLFHIQHNQAFYKDKKPFDMFGKEIYVLDKSVKVNAVELGTAVFVVAILANVFVGTINLKIKQRNFLFFRSTRLHSLSGNNTADWQSHSLEEFILKKTQIGARRVDFIVDDWIEQNRGLFIGFSKSWKDTIELVRKGMAERQLLTTVQKTYFGLFSYVGYKLPEEKEFIETQNLVKPILDRLIQYKQNNTKIWNLLLREIMLGVERSYAG